MNYLGLMETVSSVASSHERWCHCTTCRAAAGDAKAMAAIIRAVVELDQADTDAQEIVS